MVLNEKQNIHTHTERHLAVALLMEKASER